MGPFPFTETILLISLYFCSISSTFSIFEVPFLILLVNFLDLFQLSAVLFGLPDIERALKFTPEDINWVLIVYNITFASFLLIGGQLGQRLGLERTFIAGTAILTLSNIINTAAPNKAALLAGRTISGIGAGLTVSSICTELILFQPS